VTSIVPDHCRSALGQVASGLPYYYTQIVCVPDVIGGLAVWQQNKPNPETQVQYQLGLCSLSGLVCDLLLRIRGGLLPKPIAEEYQVAYV